MDRAHFGSEKPLIIGLSAACCLLTFLVWSGTAKAEPMAMVLHSSDGLDVTPFSNLSDGETLDLGADGFIEFLDYSSCKEVSVTSGRLSFTQAGFEAIGGDARVLRDGNCIGSSDIQDVSGSQKGLLTTFRGEAAINESPKRLKLRFADSLREQFGSVMIVVGNGPPTNFGLETDITTDLPAADPKSRAVKVELLLQKTAPDVGVLLKEFMLDPSTVGRQTAVVLVN